MSEAHCPRCQQWFADYPETTTDTYDGHLVHILDRDEEDDSLVTSAPIECGFDADGVFRSPNWNCQTLNELRALVNEWYEPDDERRFWAVTFRDDMRCASLGVLPIPECDDVGAYGQDEGYDPVTILQGYLVMSWYKDRGETGQAWVFWDDCPPRPLNLATADFILRWYAENHPAPHDAAAER